MYDSLIFRSFAGNAAKHDGIASAGTIHTGRAVESTVSVEAELLFPLHTVLILSSHIFRVNYLLFGAYAIPSDFVGIYKREWFVQQNLRESLPLETHQISML